MTQMIGLVGLALSVVALLFSVWAFRAIGHANKRIQAAYASIAESNASIAGSVRRIQAANASLAESNAQLQAIQGERKIGEARGMRITKLDFDGHPTGETMQLPGKVTITTQLDADKPE